MKALLAVLAVVALVGCGAQLQTEKLTALGSSPVTTITWTPVSGTVGYQYLVDGRVTSSTNSQASSVRFATVNCTSPHTCSVRALGTLKQWDTSIGALQPPTTTTITTTTTTIPTTTANPPAASSFQYGTNYSPTTATANIWVAPSGSDSGPKCVRSAALVPAPSATTACGSFQKAYSLARYGDTVGMLPGGYGEQDIRDVAGLDSTSSQPPVTFLPTAVSTVTVTEMNIGEPQNDVAAPGDGSDHLLLEGISSAAPGTGSGSCGVSVGPSAQFDTFAFDSFCDMFIQAAQNITIQNTELGPCKGSDYTNQVCNSTYAAAAAPDGYPLTSGIVWNHDVFHDYLGDSCSGCNPDPHDECVFMTTGATIENSIFYHCADFDIFMQDGSGGLGDTNGNPFTGTVLQNNSLQAPTSEGNFGTQCCGNTTVSFPEPDNGNGITVRYNSFWNGQEYWGRDTDTGNVSVGNIESSSGGSLLYCAGGMNAYNVYVGSGAQTCGGMGEVTASSWPYVNTAWDSTLNYALSGANGSTPADNLVPCSSGPAQLPFDQVGNPRPSVAGKNCDAGADER